MVFMVVDPNTAFARLLEQELVRLGHRVMTCTSGAEALSLARRDMPDLALLDMALEEPSALDLGRQLRELDAGVRLMLIPMIGDDPVLGDDDLSIQGTLTKPFFLPELATTIKAAREAPLFGKGLTASSAVQQQDDLTGRDGTTGEAWDLGSLDWLAGLDRDEPATAVVPADAGTVRVEAAAAAEAAAAEAAAAEAGIAEEATVAAGVPAAAADLEPDGRPVRDAGVSRRAFRVNQGRIETLMYELVADIGADGVLLTSSQGLLTSVGNLDEAEIELISAAVLHGVQTSAEVARILGREQVRFEQSIAGGSYMLYALSVHDAILAVTVRGDATLGLLRLAARAAAERIAALCIAT
ncbi:MAG: response regulator [Anaerolineae bacterium]|nr:response regulator [Anaerolineae bacterium]